jgi:GTP-binding protein
LLDTAAVSYQAVLTKADKISKSALEKVIAETKVALAKHPAAFPDVIATSAEKGGGVDILRAEIARLIASAGR